MRLILLHPQLRTALPRSLRRDPRPQLWARYKSQVPRPSQRHEPAPLESKDLGSTPARSPAPTPTNASAKTSIRRGPPERILVYYGGTGRAVFLGALRITTILLFGAACLIVAPTCYTTYDAWYMAPLVIVGGAVPMLYVSYTAAPYVNFVHLALPAFARKSRETAIQYARNLPPTATLYINTMRFNTIPRQTVVRLGDLVAETDKTRPVAFRNLKPAPRPWWMGKTPTQFYTGHLSRPGRQSTAFYPELWPDVYHRIQGRTRYKRSK